MYEMDEIKRIINEYKEAVAEAGCEHKRRTAMEYAFNRIFEIVEKETT